MTKKSGRKVVSVFCCVGCPPSTKKRVQFSNAVSKDRNNQILNYDNSEWLRCVHSKKKKSKEGKRSGEERKRWLHLFLCLCRYLGLLVAVVEVAVVCGQPASEGSQNSGVSRTRCCFDGSHQRKLGAVVLLSAGRLLCLAIRKSIYR